MWVLEQRAALYVACYVPGPGALWAPPKPSPGRLEVLCLDQSGDLYDLLPETPEKKYRRISRLSSMKDWALKGIP